MIKWTDEYIDFLKNNYLTMRAEDIGKIVGTSRQCVIDKAFKLGIRKLTKHLIYHNYFETWSHDMAYILGFIMGDGNVHYNKSNSGSLRIQLNIKDIEVLDFIKSKINPTAKYVSQQITIKYKLSKSFCLTVNSTYLCNSLAKYHVTPNKTGKEKLPEIPDHYKYDYFRGLFDADGCISLRKRNGLESCLSMSSKTREFLEQVNNTFCFGYGSIRKCKTVLGDWHQLTIYKKSVIRDIRNLMYNGGFCLNRKKILLDQV